MKKVIIIIGAGKGVGLEVSRKFGQEGFQIGLVGRNQDRINSIRNLLRTEGFECMALSGDASIPGDVKRVLKEFYRFYGRIDAVLYNPPGALKTSYKEVLDIEPSELIDFLQTRLVGALETAKASFPYLLESSGALVFTSGQSDRHAYPTTALIGVPQAGLKLLAEHLYLKLQEDNVFTGYTPLDNPPMYSDFEAERQRNDVPDGFFLSERVTAKDVADKIFYQILNRGPHEVRVRSSVKLNEYK